MFEINNNQECKLIKLLIPARTDTKYFHELLESGNIEIIVMFKGRLKFNDLAGAPFPSLLIYLVKERGPNINVLSYKSNGEEIL